MKIAIHQVRQLKKKEILRFIFLINNLFIAFLSTSWRQLVAWMLNIAICLVCLVKLFVYGEPIVDESEMHEYHDYKKKADQLMAEVRKQFHNIFSFSYTDMKITKDRKI